MNLGTQQQKSVGIAVGIANSPAISTQNVVDIGVDKAKNPWALPWVSNILLAAHDAIPTAIPTFWDKSHGFSHRNVDIAVGFASDLPN